MLDTGCNTKLARTRKENEVAGEELGYRDQNVG